METLRFEMTVDQINLVLEALGDKPFIRVHRLIAQIQAQAKAQLQQPDAGEEVLRAFAGMGGARTGVEPRTVEPTEQAG